MKPEILVLTGPSGTGKDTVVDFLCDKSKHYYKAISHTTRAPREGEVHGNPYYFTPEDQFFDMYRAGQFVEHASAHGNWYGIDKMEFEGDSDTCVLFIATPEGAYAIRDEYPDRTSTVFILPQKWSRLYQRLLDRGESEESAKKRVEDSKSWLQHIPVYDYVVVNQENAIHKLARDLNQITRDEHFGRKRDESRRTAQKT